MIMFRGPRVRLRSPPAPPKFPRANPSGLAARAATFPSLPRRAQPAACRLLPATGPRVAWVPPRRRPPHAAAGRWRPLGWQAYFRLLDAIAAADAPEALVSERKQLSVAIRKLMKEDGIADPKRLEQARRLYMI
jgi:hypothetical protein